MMPVLTDVHSLTMTEMLGQMIIRSGVSTTKWGKILKSLSMSQLEFQRKTKSLLLLLSTKEWQTQLLPRISRESSKKTTTTRKSNGKKRMNSKRLGSLMTLAKMLVILWCLECSESPLKSWKRKSTISLAQKSPSCMIQRPEMIKNSNS